MRGNMSEKKILVFFASRYVRYSVAQIAPRTLSYLSRKKHNFMKEIC